MSAGLEDVAPEAFAPAAELVLPAAAADDAHRLAARAGDGIHALLAQSVVVPSRFEELVLVVDGAACAALPVDVLAAAERLVERLARAGVPLAGGLRVVTREAFARDLEAMRAAPDPRAWGGPPDARQRRYHRLGAHDAVAPPATGQA
jgi:hypothetical protein